MPDKTMLARRLREAYQESREHSFLASLEGVTERMAQWKPERYRGFPHMDGSILTIAFHAAGDKLALSSLAFGDGSVAWPQVQERFQALGGNLAVVRGLAEEGQAAALAALAGQREEEMEALCPYYGGQTRTAYDIFRLMAEHDLYHAGQINYVKGLYEGERRARRT